MLNTERPKLEFTKRPQLQPGKRAACVDAIPKDLLLKRRAARRSLVDARHITNAIEHIIELPAPGESLHLLVDGRFTPCDLIPATRRLSDPAVIKRLDVTTLGLNVDNVHCIANGLDQRKILEANVLVSGYFKRLEPAEFEFLKQELEARGGRANAARTHCKLILMEMTDGNHYTIEGSGNLRACDSIEQFVMTNDRRLLLFHRKWITDYIESRGDGSREPRKRRHRHA